MRLKDATVNRIIKHAIASIILLKISKELRSWAKK